MTAGSNITAIQKFNHAVKTLLSPNTEQETKISNSLFGFIGQKINQMRLKGNVEIKEIINESYIRGMKYIEKNGKEIINADAFIKRTSCNVLQEMSRKSVKSIPLEPVAIEEGWRLRSFKEEKISERLSENEIKRFRLILENLPPLDYIILYLRVVEKLKSKEIVNELKRTHIMSESNVRQKGLRIVNKIRKEMNLS